MAKHKERTVRIDCWFDLIRFIESVNPNENTIVLSGWINHLDKDNRTHIRELYFTTKPVDILKKGNKKNVKKDKRVVSDSDKKDSTE